jgi:hypothetical protein
MTTRCSWSHLGALCVIGAAMLSLQNFLPRVATAQPLTGVGEWQSLKGDAIKGTWTAALTRSGEVLNGTFELKGSNVVVGGPVTGSIDNSSVVLGLAQEGTKRITFSARLEGDAVSGEWEYPSLQDHGVWFGSLSSSPKDN